MEPLTPEEAQAAYDNAPEVPISEAEIWAIVRRVMIMGGRAPLAEVSQAELDRAFRDRIRLAWANRTSGSGSP